MENGNIKDFNWYVNVNVMIEQIGIQPDFTSAVKAQPGFDTACHCIRGSCMPTLLHIDSSPLYNRSVSCELAATFVTQWKAYPISTSLICTTG